MYNVQPPAIHSLLYTIERRTGSVLLITGWLRTDHFAGCFSKRWAAPSPLRFFRIEIDPSWINNRSPSGKAHRKTPQPPIQPH